MDEIRQNTQDTLKDVLGSENLDKISEEVLKCAVEGVLDNQGKKDGFFGKLFGNVKDNILIYGALGLNVILLLLCLIDIVRTLFTGTSAYTELVENVIPVVTLTVGYLLGKNE